MSEVILAYRAWKRSRAKFKDSLRREGEKGPIVRRALREMIAARSEVQACIEAYRTGYSDARRHFPEGKESAS